MDKLISQQAAIDAVEFGITYAKAINKETGEVIELFKQSNEELRKAVERIKQLPSVQPERPTGEWIQKPRYEDDEYPDAQPNLKCPFCGYEIGWCDMGNYCARCGADLKGGAE